MENLVVNGLDVQTMDFISAKIKELGFNCVRLPFALDTFYKTKTIPDSILAANPDLHGKTALEILDKTVESLTNQGLLVILNNHIRCVTSHVTDLFFRVYKNVIYIGDQNVSSKTLSETCL